MGLGSDGSSYRPVNPKNILNGDNNNWAKKV